MKAEITIPKERKITVVDGDFNVKVNVSNDLFDQITKLYYKQGCAPLIKLVLESDFGDTITFHSLNLAVE